METLAEQVSSRLLDFNQPLDITLLDNVILTMLGGIGEEQRWAQQVLTDLKEHEQAWTRVEAILRDLSNPETKFYGLQILQFFIEGRWKLLPRNECEKMRDYVVRLIIETSSDSNRAEQEKVYLGKLNFIMVLILTREWPKHWPNFIPAIVEVSTTKSNDSLARNNMLILKLLSEEVFNFSSGKITEIKAKHLKDAMCSDFSRVFQLCLYFLEKSRNAELVRSTLETLLRFLTWVSEGYIFETPLITMLTDKLLKISLFRNVTLECLTEIAGMAFPKYDGAFVSLFHKTMLQLKSILPLNTNMEAFARSVANQHFIQKTAMFLCTMLMQHGQLMEQREKDSVSEALQYLLLISEVEDVELFKICLEYWNALAENLYTTMKNITPLLVLRKTGVVGNAAVTDSSWVRRVFYQSVLNRLSCIIINRMPKPEEVLIKINKKRVESDFSKDIDSINLNKDMREILLYLTHLDYVDVKRIMVDKLEKQVKGPEWSREKLSSLCWAIGSIASAIPEEDQEGQEDQEGNKEHFLVRFIEDLLHLYEQKAGRRNKASIASNIIYVVGQHSRFFRTHWELLKTVVNKLFLFMHKPQDGLKSMACDSFMKITQECGGHFVQIQASEVTPFIEDIFTNFNTIISELDPQQKLTFYEAVGYVISAQSEAPLIERYMLLLNQDWNNITDQASRDIDILKNAKIVKQLVYILKTNVSACKALGHPYFSQLGRIYLNLLKVYKVMSENISGAIALSGENVTKQSLTMRMILIKKEIIQLIREWFSRCNDPVLLDRFIPPLVDTIFGDYKNCAIPSAREPEVLSLMATIMNKLEGRTTTDIPKIFDGVFLATLEMINLNYQAYPEHRTNYYLMLEAVNKHFFDALVSLVPAQFKLVVDSIIWAVKQTMGNVAETGLEILNQLLLNVSRNEATAQSFHQAYYFNILPHVFSVVTDTSQTASFTMRATILAHMITIGKMGLVNAPPVIMPEALAVTNVVFVQNFVADLFRNAFSQLTQLQLEVTVEGLFNLDQDLAGFKNHLWDFLVQMKGFMGDDNSDLYLEERELELRRAQEEKRHVQMSVPGILNPHEIAEGMQQ